ncbi:GNAT family N-acetyltransferase [Jeotgalibacillus marinus]|uniref:GNAT family N-acetyltransferase n=1 Tax=Jeotgalibacillus marinus TaxID=86667 RepID=A0ABV3Q6A4_9BACL
MIKSDELLLRSMKPDDYTLMVKWLNDSRILEFYGDSPLSLDEVISKYSPRVEGKHYVKPFILEYKNEPIGYIQCYKITEAEYKAYDYSENENIFGIDQFIGEVEHWNKGIGTLLVTLIVNYLVEHKKADRVVMDPQIRNTRAIRCYEKCGFEKVKILPKRELHEGEYQDCWLIEYKN